MLRSISARLFTLQARVLPEAGKDRERERERQTTDDEESSTLSLGSRRVASEDFSQALNPPR